MDDMGPNALHSASQYFISAPIWGSVIVEVQFTLKIPIWGLPEAPYGDSDVVLRLQHIFLIHQSGIPDMD